MRFQDKICLVTGAASGIGRATAERFAAEGGRVAVIDLNAEASRQVAEAITAAGGQAVSIAADVGNPADVKKAVDDVARRWGRVDVLVNNAALMRFSPVVEMNEADWNHVIATNLGSVFLFTKLCLPLMKKGAIVNVSSVHAHENTANCSSYAASKGGIEAFTRALSRELPEGIRVNCVAPGAVNTPMLWNNPNVKSGKEKVEGAVGEPADLAAAICFLAADEARFVQGTTLVVDGGRLDIL
jgi:glucose 1-dehydrogenase